MSNLKVLPISWICFIIAACGSQASQDRNTRPNTPEKKERKYRALSIDKCSIEINAQGDTLVSNEKDGYAIVLGGDGWEIDCKNRNHALIASAEGLTVQAAKAPRTADDPDGKKGLLTIIEAVKESMDGEGSFKPGKPVKKEVGEEKLPATCFSGRLTVQGDTTIVYSCFTQKTPLAGPHLITIVTYYVSDDVWKKRKSEVELAVEGTSGSWHLFERIE